MREWLRVREITNEKGRSLPQSCRSGATPARLRDGLDLTDMAPGHTLVEAAATPPPTVLAS